MNNTFQNLQAVTRELRHGLQQREGNYRSSTNQWSPTAPQDHPGTEQVEVRVQVMTTIKKIGLFYYSNISLLDLI